VLAKERKQAIGVMARWRWAHGRNDEEKHLVVEWIRGTKSMMEREERLDYGG
jgi:hypothetical protein